MVVSEQGQPDAGDPSGDHTPPADDTPPVGHTPPGDDADLDTDLEADTDLDAGEGRESPPPTAWTRLDGIVCAGLVVFALVLVALHVRAYPTLSPIDELQHVDYVIKAGRFDVPRQGERLGFEAMSEAACRGIDATEYRPPPCGLDEYDPADFPENGINTSASQLPVYYTVTGVVGRAVTALPGIGSPVTAARLVGGLWLGAALAVLWYLLALFSVPRRQRAVVVVLTASTPLVLLHSATVNADALLLLTGAVALLATVQFERRRLRWWWLLAVYVGLILVEPTNLLAAGLGAAYLLVRVTPRPDETWARRLVPLAAAVTVVVIRLEVLSRLRRALYPPLPPSGAGPRPTNVARAVTEVSMDRVLSQLPSVFTPIGNTFLPLPLDTTLTVNLIQLSNWLLIGLVVAAALVYVAERDSAWLARWTIVAMLLAGPLYTFYYAYFSNVDFPAPGRFGLPLLPALMVVSASAIRTRSALVVSASLSGVVLAGTVFWLLTP